MSKHFKPQQRANLSRRKMITGGSPNASHNAFLDANVFGRLMRANFDPIAYVENTLRSAGETNVTAVNIITSPFALFEYLGVKVPKPPALRIDPQDFHNLVAPVIYKKVMVYATDFYQKTAATYLKNLRQRTKDMRKHLSPEAYILYDGLVVSFTNPEREGILGQALAWDFTMNIQVPAKFHKKYYEEMMTGLAYFHSTGTNFTFTKPAAEFMRYYIKEYYKGQQIDEYAQDAKESLNFKTARDHIDRELLHFALVGWHYNTGMPFRTHCITADPVEAIEHRLINIGLIYRRFYGKLWIDNYRAELGKVVDALPGYIHCLDPASLKIVKSFNCSNYFQPGTEPSDL